jgi:hypothetical protein
VCNVLPYASRASKGRVPWYTHKDLIYIS